MNNQLKNNFKPSVIGVDLGNLYTKIAAIDKGAVDIITNQANLRQTPSIVGYGNNERLIGQSGYVKIKSNMSNTIIAPQRYLGQSYSQSIREEAKKYPCVPRNQDNKVVFNINCQGNLQKLIPEQITAALFTNVNKIVQLNSINNKYLVVSVPNYFTHHERQGLLNSIQIARNSMQNNYGYSLVNQSTAVGMDYGFYKKNQFPQKQQQAKTVLFIDFGHYKISAYAIKFTKNYQKTIFYKSIRNLGCKNLDQTILNFYSNLFEKQYPNTQSQICQSKRATLKLLQNIQKQRKTLTGISQYDFSIDCLLEDNDFAYTMKRSQFQEICSPVINQLTQFFEQIKQQIKNNNINISNIELIGGGSRIPFFIRKISQCFQMEPSRTLNSSQSIARGAGLCAAMYSGIFRLNPYHSIECASNTIKVKIHNKQTNESLVYPVLLQGEVIFNKILKQINVKNADLQIRLEILTKQKGIEPLVCQFEINKIQQMIEQRKIVICLQFDINTIIRKIDLFKQKQGGELIQINNLKFIKKYQDKDIKYFSQKQKQFNLKDISIIQNYERKNKFQSEVYNLKDKLSQIKNNNQLKDFIHPQILQQSIAFFNQIQQSFGDNINYQQTIKKCHQKINQVYKSAQQARKTYFKVQQALRKLKQFVKDVINGKIKSIRFYPRQQIQKIQQWFQNIASNSQIPKYQGHNIKIQHVQQVQKQLKKNIQEYQNQQLRRQRQAQNQRRKAHYQQPGSQNYGRPLNSFGFGIGQNNQSGYNNEGYPRRTTRNNSNGFFPSFSKFF